MKKLLFNAGEVKARFLFGSFLFFISNSGIGQSTNSLATDQIVKNNKMKILGELIIRDSTGNLIAPGHAYELLAVNKPAVGFMPVKMEANRFTEIMIYQDADSTRVKQLKRMLFGNDKFIQGLAVKNFSFKEITGNILSGEKLKGRIVVFNMWFTNCLPCRKEIPFLNELFQKYSAKDVEFIALSLSDNEDGVRKFLQHTAFNYKHVASLACKKTLEKWEIISYPTHIVLDKDGNTAFYGEGADKSSLERLEKAIQNLIKQK